MLANVRKGTAAPSNGRCGRLQGTAGSGRTRPSMSGNLTAGIRLKRSASPRRSTTPDGRSPKYPNVSFPATTGSNRRTRSLNETSFHLLGHCLSDRIPIRTANVCGATQFLFANYSTAISSATTVRPSAVSGPNPSSTKRTSVLSGFSVIRACAHPPSPTLFFSL